MFSFFIIEIIYTLIKVLLIMILSFSRIHYMSGTLLSTLFYSLFTVKVGTLIISPFHILKKMRLREIKLIVKHHIESMFKSVSDTKVHAFSTVLNAPYSWQIIFLLFHLLSNFTYILMLVSF